VCHYTLTKIGAARTCAAPQNLKGEIMHNILACDPGVPLTLALLNSKGKLIAIAEKDDVATNFKKRKWDNNPILITSRIEKWLAASKRPMAAVIERVGSMPGEGVVSACKFTGSYYTFLGICAALHIPVTQVTPPKWKRDLGIHYTKDLNLKEASRSKAITEFPNKTDWFRRKMDHDRAEASLIGLWLLKHGDGK